MATLICVLLLGVMLGGPVARAGRKIAQAINHFLLVALILVVAVLLLAAAGQ